jgi:hypothetical protein
MDGKHIRELIEAGEAVYEAYLDLVTWVKTNAGQAASTASRASSWVSFGSRCRNRNNVQMASSGVTDRASGLMLELTRSEQGASMIWRHPR